MPIASEAAAGPIQNASTARATESPRRTARSGLTEFLLYAADGRLDPIARRPSSRRCVASASGSDGQVAAPPCRGIEIADRRRRPAFLRIAHRQRAIAIACIAVHVCDEGHLPQLGKSACSLCQRCPLFVGHAPDRASARHGRAVLRRNRGRFRACGNRVAHPATPTRAHRPGPTRRSLKRRCRWRPSTGGWHAHLRQSLAGPDRRFGDEPKRAPRPTSWRGCASPPTVAVHRRRLQDLRGRARGGHPRVQRDAPRRAGEGHQPPSPAVLAEIQKSWDALRKRAHVSSSWTSPARWGGRVQRWAVQAQARAGRGIEPSTRSRPTTR